MVLRKKAPGRKAPTSSEEIEENDEGEETEGEGDDDGEGEEEDGGERPPVSMEEKVDLFKGYQQAVDTEQEFTEALDSARVEVEAAVKEIYDRLGNGPFVWRKKNIRVIKRKYKDKDKYFVRAESADLEEIVG